MDAFLTYTVIGVVTGAIYAVTASGLVVTYTTSGVFNFAHGAVGMAMAFLYWQLRVDWAWPAPIALLVVLLVAAPLLGAVIERVLMRRLYNAPVGVSLVVTSALLVIMLGLALDLWPSGQARRLPEFFAGNSVGILGLQVTYHQLIVLATAGGIAVVLRLLMFHTRTGVTMRAVVDNRDLAGMNGVVPERIAQLSWALGSVLAALAGILIASQTSLDQLQLTLLVINGYAAAMLGRLKSLPLTFIGAILLGLGVNYVIGYGGNVSLGSFRLIDAASVVPTVFLLLILVFLPQVKLRAGRLVASAAPRVPSLRESLVASIIFVLAMAALSTMLSESWLLNLGIALVTGITALSLVLLSGFAGQISLMQMSFVGLGALVAGRTIGTGSVWGIAAAFVVCAAVGALVALPALRLQELYLALATFAVALFSGWAFNQSWGFSQGGSIQIPRLRLPGVVFASEQSQLILLSFAFCAVGVVVLVIRRGPYGRRLAAMRDSPVAASMVGLNLVTTKLTVFALSAGIAGMSGALFGALRATASPADFDPIKSLFLYLTASFGGLTTVVGALFAGLFLAVMPDLTKHLPLENAQNYLIGLGAISLASNPHGFGGSIAMAGVAIRAALGRRRPRVRAATPALTKVGAS